MTRLHRILLEELAQTIHRHGLIGAGDRVLVAVSGGKDSLALWQLLQDFRAQMENFDLCPVHVEAGFGARDREITTGLKAFFASKGDTLHTVSRSYGQEIEQLSLRQNPCFRCSRQRRKALVETANERGCNKIALAHHRDDVIETLILNIFFSREISTMLPLQPLFGGKFHIIRPLWYTDERRLAIFAREQNFPIFESPCPFSGKTKRSRIKRWLAELEKENPRLRDSIFQSLFHVNLDFLPEQKA